MELKIVKIDPYFYDGLRAEYKKGELIIRPQESSEYVYLIESGFVKAYSITKYGEENVHIIRGKGDIFPLIWVLISEHRDIAYEAMEPTVVWRQPKNTFLDYLTTNHDATTAMLDLTIRAYRTYAEHVNTLEYRTVRERVVSFLLACSRRFGTKLPDGTTQIKAPLRQQDIASSVNASRETTSRELTALTRKGMLCIDDRTIIIKDAAAMQKLL